MKRFAILAYGLVCYAIFFATFLYAIGYVFTMDATPNGRETPLALRLLVDAGLVLLFALQHSVMARQSFKRAWTRIIPPVAERSTYVLLASLALLLLFRFWQPIVRPIWKVENPLGVVLLQVLFGAGWLIVLVSTFVIDHFELFGLKQVWYFFTGKEFKSGGFVTPGPYRFVRHPLYLGFIIAFWSTPTMTAGHLLFAVMTTAYIFVAIRLEERDLTAILGDQYLSYQKSVSMLTPLPPKKTS
jgi:methanethiol S-methyltransferase